MRLQPGGTCGPFLVEGRAGAGGMGEVYKARDTRLHRTVALKVIAAGHEHDVESRERFTAEARAIAALNHPHICTVFDARRDGGLDILVLEYLEGETLADRIARHGITPTQVVEWGAQIADALDYAHRRGILHRDLKPTNIHISRDGRAKLLDFGLAKLRADSSAAASLSGLDTAPVPQTAEGSIHGTLHYLAPERLDGREADVRSEVFAFGAVLYEMITGRKAFDEPTRARLIASLVSADPPPIDSSTGAPPMLQWTVDNCLAKDPDARWQSMADVAKVLRSCARLDPPLPTTGRRWFTLTAAGLGLAVAVFASLQFRRQDVPSRTGSIVSAVLPPSGGAFALSASSVNEAQFALAPDAHAIAFVAATAGDRPQLWLRELDRAEPRAIPGTTGASYPFWSADSGHIGFFADGWLKKVALAGRPSQPICKAPNGRGGAWRGDTIVFSADVDSALFQVEAAGGAPRPLTTLSGRHSAHRWPQFLPDGRLLFFVRSAVPDDEGIYAISPNEPGTGHRVMASAANAIFAGGYLLFEREGELTARPFDHSTLRFSGEAQPVGLSVGVSSVMQTAVSASFTGVLATSSRATPGELVWFDSLGNRQGTAGMPDRYIDFRLSPDESRLAVSRVDPVSHRAGLGILDLVKGGLTMLSSARYMEASPVWSPDSSRLVFRSNPEGEHDLFERPVRGGEIKRLYSNGIGLYPTGWSGEAGLLVFHYPDPTTKHDIWTLDPRDPSRSARAVVGTAAIEAQGQLTADGRLAYISDESGTMNVHVRALDNRTSPVNVSVTGGHDPRWRADGKELYFISAAGRLMAASFAGTDQMQVTGVRPLFAPPGSAPASAPYLSRYVVTGDGRRFLFNVPAQPPGEEPLTLTIDWTNRLQATAGQRR